MNHPRSRYVNSSGCAMGDGARRTRDTTPRFGERGMIPVTQFRTMRARRARRGLSAATLAAAGALAVGALGAAPAGATARATTYRQINMVSDQQGKAGLRDRDLVNGWGLAASPGTDS